MIEPQGAGERPGLPASPVRLSARREWTAPRFGGARAIAVWALLGVGVAAATIAPRPYALGMLVVYSAGMALLLGRRLPSWLPSWGHHPDQEALRRGALVRFGGRGGQGRLAIRLVEGVVLVQGEPIGGPAAPRTTVAELLSWAQRRGWAVGFEGVGAEHLMLYQGMGFQACRRGRAAVIDLAASPLEGRRLGLRMASGTARPADLQIEVFLQGLPDGALSRGLGEFGASVGDADSTAALQAGDPIVVARDADGLPRGVAVWRRDALAGNVLRLQRLATAAGAAPGLGAYLLTYGLRQLGAAGYRHAVLGQESGASDLGEGPWSAGGRARARAQRSDLALAQLADACGAHWCDQYLLYTQTALLPGVLYAVQRAARPRGPIALPHLQPTGGRPQFGAPSQTRPRLYRPR